MVGIDGNGFVANFYYTNDLGAARSLCLELHAWLDGVYALESRARNRLDELFVYFTVAFSWLYGNFNLVASVLLGQRTFQSADDVLCTFQVCQGLTAFYAGGIELLSLVVSERVMDGDNTRLGHVISLRVAMTVYLDCRQSKVIVNSQTAQRD